jgi:hypothetical protein
MSLIPDDVVNPKYHEEDYPEESYEEEEEDEYHTKQSLVVYKG